MENTYEEDFEEPYSKGGSIAEYVANESDWDRISIAETVSTDLDTVIEVEQDARSNGRPTFGAPPMNQGIFKSPKESRTPTTQEHTFSNPNLPYGHENLPSWSLFEGWMFRREWQNPYPENSPRGKVAAKRRQEYLKQRDRSVKVEGLLNEMRGRKGKDPKLDNRSDRRLYYATLQEEHEEVDKALAAHAAEKAQWDEEEGALKAQLAEAQLAEVESEGVKLMEDAKRTQAALLDAQEQQRSLKVIAQQTMEEAYLVQQDLVRLEHERAALQEERDAVEDTRNHLSNMRIFHSSVHLR
ncbi:hypothetical protein CYMTET_30344 [Cymbomonas tetramitiformis]|uniref:Uncharacterized protein n=1 Tax=Cymbomonas tetramitiformis TaxID=36881 RepID=A0AAE0FJ97_9CHLO|nr:hypothetical protein CYMTET_30344 [Cymbomonas tetramitiformis]